MKQKKKKKELLKDDPKCVHLIEQFVIQVSNVIEGFINIRSLDKKNRLLKRSFLSASVVV